MWVSFNSLYWVLFTVEIPHLQLWDVLVSWFISVVISVFCLLCLSLPEPPLLGCLTSQIGLPIILCFFFLLLSITLSSCFTFWDIPSSLSFIPLAFFTLLSCLNVQKRVRFSECTSLITHSSFQGDTIIFVTLTILKWALRYFSFRIYVFWNCFSLFAGLGLCLYYRFSWLPAHTAGRLCTLSVQLVGLVPWRNFSVSIFQSFLLAGWSDPPWENFLYYRLKD